MIVGGDSHLRQIVGGLAMNPGVPLRVTLGELTYTPQHQYIAVCLANN